MAIYQRRGSRYWWYGFEIHDIRFRGSTKATTRQDAEIVEGLKRSEALRQILDPDAKPAKQPLTLSQAMGRYWMEHGSTVASAVDIKRQSSDLIRIIGGNVRLSDIDNDKVLTFISKRRGESNRTRKRQKQRVGPRTVNADLVHLRTVMKRARDIWHLDVGRVDWPKLMLAEPDGRETSLTIEEVHRLLDNAVDHIRPIIEAALLTGQRRENLATLDWRQVDMTARKIRFRVKSKKPGGRNHMVDISNPMQALLTSLGPRSVGPVFTRQKHTEEGLAYLRQTEAVVTRHDGNLSVAGAELGITDNAVRKRMVRAKVLNPSKPVPLGDFSKAWRAALRRAKIEDFRFHDLRHTAATWMIRKKVPLDVVQKILGHKDIKTTQRYAHHEPAAQMDALNQIDLRNPHRDEPTFEQVIGLESK